MKLILYSFHIISFLFYLTQYIPYKLNCQSLNFIIFFIFEKKKLQRLYPSLLVWSQVWQSDSLTIINYESKYLENTFPYEILYAKDFSKGPWN